MPSIISPHLELVEGRRLPMQRIPLLSRANGTGN
jgi:hypothetical protein